MIFFFHASEGHGTKDRYENSVICVCVKGDCSTRAAFNERTKSGVDVERRKLEFKYLEKPYEVLAGIARNWICST